MISHKFNHKSRVISIIGLLCLLLLASCKNSLQVTPKLENKQQNPDIALELKQQNKSEDLSQTKEITDVLVWKGMWSADQQLAMLNEVNPKQINLEHLPIYHNLNSLSSTENKSSTNPPITSILRLVLEQPKISSTLTKDNQASSASLERMHIEPSQNQKPKALSEQKRPDLEDLIILPKDVLKIIMCYVGLKEMSQVRLLNRSFYGLMTGYNQPGLLGVQPKSQSGMQAELWKANKVVDFSKKAYRALTPTNFPSFPFYQLVGKVKNLPTSFWPYLKEVNVHKLSFDFNQIDDQGVAELAKHLKGTNVQELDLGFNQIGDQGVVELAKYLKGTNVRKLNLIKNQIGAQGAVGLAKYLKGTNVQELDLGFNQIGAQGASELVKYLKDTDVHTLDLGGNKIDAQGAAELAKYLKDTNVRTLYLGGNQIGAQGASELAKYLKDTNVQELYLGNNQIGAQGATELAKYLKDTNVHKLNLRRNQIGAQGATELAKYLKRTNVHTLDLGYNQIGAQRALELAKYLKDTKVQELDLGDNDINIETQNSLKRQYPNIRWIF